jgi:myosin heavy subunit
LKEKDETIAQKDETIAELREQTRRLEKEKGVVVEEKESLRELRHRIDEIDRLERQLGRIKQQLEESEQIIAQFQKRIAEVEQLRPATHMLSRSKVQQDTIKLTWRRGKEALCNMRNSCSAAVDDSTLYVHLATSHQILSYNSSTSSWSQLPYSPMKFCSPVIIKNVLSLVGGYDYSGALSNQLFSLTGEGSGMRWTEEFPPMPTKRALLEQPSL